MKYFRKWLKLGQKLSVGRLYKSFQDTKFDKVFLGRAHRHVLSNLVNKCHETFFYGFYLPNTIASIRLCGDF